MSKLILQGLSIDTGNSSFQSFTHHHQYKRLTEPSNSFRYNPNNNNTGLTINTGLTNISFTNRPSYSQNLSLASQPGRKTFYKFAASTNNINDKHDDKQIKQNKTESNFIEINDILGPDSQKPISLDILDFPVDNYENSKFSSKNMGTVKAYGANTHQGLVRNYNEDRVSIIINMNRPTNFSKHQTWPKVSFFGIYDGHGGSTCAEFLRDNLHKFICNDPSFPNNVIDSIKHGFALAEKDYIINYAINKNDHNIVNDRSGSCAVVLIIVDTKCYVANVGDSRAIMSVENGKVIKDVTIDHKPNNPKEKSRILENGGKVYQSQTPVPSLSNQILIGPYRVMPGRLSVSRTIGDVEAKKTNFGGLPNVIIAVPEIFVIDLTLIDVDFFILGCDGIFDQMASKDVAECAWMVFKNDTSTKNENNKVSPENNQKQEEKNIHSKCGKAIDLILKSSMFRKSFDNVTSLIVMVKDIFDTNNNNNHINNINGNNFKKPKPLNLDTDIAKTNNIPATSRQSNPKVFNNIIKTSEEVTKSNMNPNLKRFEIPNSKKEKSPLINKTDSNININNTHIISNNKRHNISGMNTLTNNPINTSLTSSRTARNTFQKNYNSELSYKTSTHHEHSQIHNRYSHNHSENKIFPSNPLQSYSTLSSARQTMKPYNTTTSNKFVNKTTYRVLSHNKFMNHNRNTMIAPSNSSQMDYLYNKKKIKLLK